ncbi:MAG: AlwI family type II restriction endonuclease [Elusimicrobiota bacterium]
MIALAHSPLVGRIRGKPNENAFARLLHINEIVGITRVDADVSDLGRKWRAALSQLGFIVPEVSAKIGVKQGALGEPFTVTNNGNRLIAAETVTGMQECFLRSLAAYYIPSALERNYDFKMFSPLRHTLAIMLELEKKTGESRLNFLEMGLIVQLTSSDQALEGVIKQILTFRESREAAVSKRHFDQETLKKAAEKYGYVASTFGDYADTNFRYLKATGFVQSKGHGLAIVPEKHLFVEKLVQDSRIPESDSSYLVALCNGAALPTDNREAALAVLKDLVDQTKRRGLKFAIEGKKLEQPGDIAVVRHEIEDLLFKQNEEEYASRQVSLSEEIAAYMELIITRRSRKTLSNGGEIELPLSEVPAYFEWILWRAFLAINSLANKPYDARRFKIDQDFLPIGTAPGNGPDLIFEFGEFVVVVEVTLTDNSWQEACEGEPVRRHVADLVAVYGKPVYGLFIANNIDSNTAETFRIGVWYSREDSKMRLNIVPVTLTQFKEFFEALFQANKVNVASIRGLLDACGELRQHHEAPAWKNEIERTLRVKISELVAA